MDLDMIPVLIGAGQITDRESDIALAASPMDLMEGAVRAAADDAGIASSQLARLDIVAVVKSLYEFTRNSPEVLARRLNASAAKQWITPVGGNMPQYLVNRFAEEIANGKTDFVLLAGTEAMATGRKIVKSGNKINWSEPSEHDPEHLVVERPMATDHEVAHDIWPARYVYPLFENALRGHYDQSIEDHQLEMGRLFSRFSEVAADNPQAWYQVKRSAEEIAYPGERNRFVGWPYTKFMNAMNQVNQSAAILMTSVGRARAMGVPEEKWVYLHGCGDANEIWHVSDRVNYHSSPAIAAMGRHALQMAGRDISEIDFIDLYACFPSAVQIARDELGIARDDPRHLTVTGGLPFHGGAGSYVMNAIATMMDKVRAQPGKFGMITANGGYLSEHAAGIYATERPPLPPSDEAASAPWRRVDPALYQAEIDALAHPAFTEYPDGAAVIETYTVGFGRDSQPDRAIVVGRLGAGGNPDATRFIAHTPVDVDLFHAMTREDFLGKPGRVRRAGEKNIFTPN